MVLACASASTPSSAGQPPGTGALIQQLRKNPIAPRACKELVLGKNQQAIARLTRDPTVKALVLRALGKNVKGAAAARLVNQNPGLVAWACGRIYTAHLIENGTSDDAQKIRRGVERLGAIVVEVAAAFGRSKARGKSRAYDGKLIEELGKISRTRGPELRRLQSALFRTHYAFMDGVTIDRLFSAYNNALRLTQEVAELVQLGRRSHREIDAYLRGARVSKKYGVVFAEDKGSYYLGQLVEVGDVVCKNSRTKTCKNNRDILGFKVRAGPWNRWTSRPSKQSSKVRVHEIVIPIIPDEHWRRVAGRQSGWAQGKTYLSRMSMVAALVKLSVRDHKPLLKSLGKYAARTRHPRPF